ncbi:MAG: NUDIX hydrolase [candidate division Zixibacteria bacterium]|nr:NUDIX hydrolase [candidate division Zixibacteria bacterium]
MYFTSLMVQAVADRYGYPPVLCMEAPVGHEEYNYIYSTQTFGRCHDITFYIFKGSQVIVNAKHHYPPGLYRAPSGGLKPEEKFIEGVIREVDEETGAKIELVKYLLQVNVFFSCGEKAIPWKTHVFKADYISGKLAPIDTREIREVKLVDMVEFEQYKKIITGLESGGLRYRARLHDEVIKFL